nr:TlpA disulfide reductase family protein [uncultured Chitinophaga sp.]
MKTWLTCLLCSVAMTTQAQKRTVIVLDVKGQPGDSIYSGLAGAATQKGEIGPDGRYKYVFHLKQPAEATVWAEPNKTRQQLFMEPGDSLVVSYNIHHQDSTIRFEGKGAKNNTFFKAFQSIAAAGFKQLNFSVSTTANDFANYLRHNHDLEQTLLKEKGSQMSPAIRKYLTAMSFINYACGSFQTPMMMQGYLGKKVAESIPDDYWSYGSLMNEDVSMDTGTFDYERLLVHGYPYYLFLKKQKENNTLGEKVSSDERYKQMYALAMNTYKNPQIKSKALGGILKTLISGASTASTYKGMMDDYLNQYCKDEGTRKSLVELYNKKSAISVGQVPPAFTLKDMQGRDVTLADFKGKVVYMDFWASWCSPCRYEMKNGSPGLHKQFEGNKDVVFLYISIDDSTDKWKQAIAEDHIEGVHLLSTGGTESKVAKTFNISGIPHYMIIDKEGKLFSNNATRPSQPETAETLKKLLTN